MAYTFRRVRLPLTSFRIITSAIRIAQLTGPLCDGEQLLPPQFRNLGKVSSNF